MTEPNTEKLIGKDFGVYGYEKPTHYKSLINVEVFDRNNFANIEEVKRGFSPLPKELYPYELILLKP
jgi:hypothetical protein